METRSLGDTGITVSRLGLGLAALGRPGYINLGHGDDLGGDYRIEAMEAQAHRVLDAAWQAGVRYFDAARSYGRGEAFLASWLARHKLSPSDVVIGSKWGYRYTAEWQVEAEQHEVKDHSLSHLRRQWQESRTLLRDNLRLYQIHSATVDSDVLEDSAVLDELARLKAEAGVKIGLTTSGLDQGAAVDKALAIERDNERLFDTVEATWNLLEPSAGPALARAHEAGMGVMVKEALANGRLTPRNRDPAFGTQLALLASEASRLDTTVDALALAAILAQPWADVVLSGAATEEQLASNLKALDVTWEEATAARLQALQEEPGTYWQARKYLPWN